MVCLFMSDPKKIMPFKGAAAPFQRHLDTVESWFRLSSYYRDKGNQPEHSDLHNDAVTLFEHVEYLLGASEIDYTVIGAWKAALRLSDNEMGMHLFPLRAEWALKNGGAINPAYFENKFSTLDVYDLSGEHILNFCRFIGVHPADLMCDHNSSYSINDYMPLPRGIIEACILIYQDETAFPFDKYIVDDALDIENEVFHAQITNPSSPYLISAAKLYYDVTPYLPLFRDHIISAEEAYEILMAAQNVQYGEITHEIKRIDAVLEATSKALADSCDVLFQTSDEENYFFALNKMQAFLKECDLSDTPRENKIEALIEELEDNIEAYTRDGKMRIGRGSGHMITYAGKPYINFNGIIRLMATAYVDSEELDKKYIELQDKESIFLHEINRFDSKEIFGDKPRSLHTLPPKQWRFFDNAWLMSCAFSRDYFQRPKQISFGQRASSDDKPEP